MEINDTRCCGLKEIDGLSGYDNPKEAMLDLCKIMREDHDLPPNFAYILFTGVIKDGYGQRFTNFIRRNKLGSVRAGKQTRNPNSSNVINAWLWQINIEGLNRWYSKKEELENW